MESLPKAEILEFNPDTLQCVRALYELDKPGQMKEAVDILDAWVKMQNHFIKKDFSREYLEIAIISTKGSVERAKARLDKYCTLRTLVPALFGDYDVRKDFDHIYYKNFIHAALPKLTPDNYRTFIYKPMGSFENSKILMDYYRLHIIFAEYLRNHDYAAGRIYFCDFTDVNVLSYATNSNVMDLQQIVTMLMEGYGVRIKGIHILTTSKVVGAVVTLFKQVFGAKIGSRIEVHKTLETLYNIVPKDSLPVEYGGKERPLKDLHEEWTDVLNTKEEFEHRKEMNRACTNESLRPTDKFNTDYMGLPGTFRTLSVD